MIREKSPRDRVAMQFKSAGLGDQSAREAARLLCESGISFETAAVLGQRMDEECTATPSKIREAARRFRRLKEGAPTQSAWGRPLQEPTPEAPTSSTPAKPLTARAGLKRPTQIVHEDKTAVIGGVLQHEVVEYQPVAHQLSATEELPRRTAWGRKVED